MTTTIPDPVGESMSHFDAVLELRIANELRQSRDPRTPDEWRRTNAEGFFHLFLSGSDPRLTPEMRAMRAFYDGLIEMGDYEWPARGFDDADPWVTLLTHFNPTNEIVGATREYIAWAALGAYRWNPFQRQMLCILNGGWDRPIRDQIYGFFRKFFIPGTIPSGRQDEAALWAIRNNHNDRIRIGHATKLGGYKDMRTSGFVTRGFIHNQPDGSRTTETRIMPAMHTTFAMAGTTDPCDPVMRSRAVVLYMSASLYMRESLVNATAKSYREDRELLGQHFRIVQLLCFFVENLIKVHALDDIVCDDGICRTVTIAKAATRFLTPMSVWDLMNLLRIQPFLVMNDEVRTYVHDLRRRAGVA